MKYAETNFQRAISVPERLMLTLRYLATGIQFRQLQYSFRISKSAVAAIVIEVCKAIWETLVKKHMPQPTTDDFKNIAADFWTRWQFPIVWDVWMANI
nr:unnamed protein product [Callosobruchus chinensis]